MKSTYRLASKDNAVGPLSLAQQCAYALPVIPQMFLFGPLGVIQGVYAKYFGLSLGAIATVLLISRLFDAVSDPVVGYLSDFHYRRSGSRKPFVIFGGLLFIISSYFLYMPTGVTLIDGSVQVSATYFLVWFLMFYLGWTVLEIPHLAWGSEITTDNHIKNTIFSLRSGATFLGVLLFYAVPFLPFFSSQEITPKTLKWAVLVAGLIMLPALYFCVKSTPDAKTSLTHNQKKSSLWGLRKEILANKPFLLFAAAFGFYGVGAMGMWFTLMFIFVDSYLMLGNYFAFLTLVSISASILSIRLWWLMANRWGKKNTWILGVLLYLLGIISVSFLTPGATSTLGLSIAMLLIYVGATPVVSISPSLLSDIIDYSTWKFKSNNTATYFSLYMLVFKASVAIGGAIGLGIAGWYGFDPSATSHSQDAVFGLRLAACWLSALLMLIATLIMLFVPINTRRHVIIRRCLDVRQMQ